MVPIIKALKQMLLSMNWIMRTSPGKLLGALPKQDTTASAKGRLIGVHTGVPGVPCSSVKYPR